jgi:hypothetical protein
MSFIFVMAPFDLIYEKSTYPSVVNNGGGILSMV